MRQKVKYRMVAVFEAEVDTDWYPKLSMKEIIEECRKQYELDDGFEVLIEALEGADIKVETVDSQIKGGG